MNANRLDEIRHLTAKLDECLAIAESGDFEFVESYYSYCAPLFFVQFWSALFGKLLLTDTDFVFLFKEGMKIWRVLESKPCRDKIEKVG